MLDKDNPEEAKLDKLLSEAKRIKEGTSQIEENFKKSLAYYKREVEIYTRLVELLKIPEVREAFELCGSQVQR